MGHLVSKGVLAYIESGLVVHIAVMGKYRIGIGFDYQN